MKYKYRHPIKITSIIPAKEGMAEYLIAKDDKDKIHIVHSISGSYPIFPYVGMTGTVSLISIDGYILLKEYEWNYDSVEKNQPFSQLETGESNHHQ